MPAIRAPPGHTPYLEPSAHLLLRKVEFTAESWRLGDYPTIVSVQRMVADTVETDLDLSLLEKAGEAGADVAYESGSGNVQIGYSDHYTAINTGTLRVPGWTKVRIGLRGMGSFDGVINALNQLAPRNEVGSQCLPWGRHRPRGRRRSMPCRCQTWRARTNP